VEPADSKLGKIPAPADAPAVCLETKYDSYRAAAYDPGECESRGHFSPSRGLMVPTESQQETPLKWWF
jgi:hypothetical protein